MYSIRAFHSHFPTPKDISTNPRRLITFHVHPTTHGGQPTTDRKQHLADKKSISSPTLPPMEETTHHTKQDPHPAKRDPTRGSTEPTEQVRRQTTRASFLLGDVLLTHLNVLIRQTIPVIPKSFSRIGPTISFLAQAFVHRHTISVVCRLKLNGLCL